MLAAATSCAFPNIATWTFLSLSASLKLSTTELLVMSIVIEFHQTYELALCFPAILELLMYVAV